jgi:hypothetical protein
MPILKGVRTDGVLPPRVPRVRAFAIFGFIRESDISKSDISKSDISKSDISSH